MATTKVLGMQLQPGDLIWNGGYVWRVVTTWHENNPQNPVGARWCVECVWSGIGTKPNFYNDGLTFALRDDLPWTRAVETEPAPALPECMQEDHLTTCDEEGM